jgi:hypothetical protein
MRLEEMPRRSARAGPDRRVSPPGRGSRFPECHLTSQGRAWASKAYTYGGGPSDGSPVIGCATYLA